MIRIPEDISWPSRRNSLLLAAFLCVIAVVVWWALRSRGRERTDDAYIEAHVISVMPKVPAYIAKLQVDDNTRVNKGDLLVVLDPRDYQNQVEAARAALGLEIGKLAEAKSQENVAEAEAAQEAAEAVAANANSKFASNDFKRFSSVSDVRAVSGQRIENSKTVAEAARATADAAAKKASAARATVGLALAQEKAEESAVEQARANLNQAQLNLSYTHITASEAGTIARKTAEVGNYVQPGQLLFYVVPLRPYVIANFKETQVDRMVPGQKVDVQVDAFPDLNLKGHVDSIQRGSGSRFALLPPENATGNFVKVVQRIPVKIVLDAPEDGLGKLAPGMSVEASVSTGD